MTKLFIDAVADGPFSDDMQAISTVIGGTSVAKLMIELGGTCLYIPKPSNSVIAKYLLEKYDQTNLLTLMQECRISQSKAYRMLRQLKNSQNNLDLDLD